MIAFGGFIFGWDTGTISGFVNHSDFIAGSYKNDKGPTTQRKIISGLGVGGIAVLSYQCSYLKLLPNISGEPWSNCTSVMVIGWVFSRLLYQLRYQETIKTPLNGESALVFASPGLHSMVSGMMFVPESPRYLIEVGKDEEAQRSLSKSNKVSV
ncbi:ABH_G0047630.mRNA.1.CDS.1 [Saccharomyces cerevisiae]|nr:ABH_G0047630.mRNA.1.CDS.1 [Saccharomyces cerevisiae]CAI6872465.1 ABH_G0047630.mRNA.1.CDS.1 [Saccharomyces cerevisiae]